MLGTTAKNRVSQRAMALSYQLPTPDPFSHMSHRREFASRKKVKAPDCAGALALEGYIRLRKQCQYLLPPFGAAMVSPPEPALS